MKKLISLILAVLMIAGVFTACGSKDAKEDSNTQTGGVITVATNAEFPPFEYLDGDKVVGADIEIAEAIAEKLGKTIEVTNIDFDAALTGAATGKYDMAIAGITANDERKANMNFSDDYYKASQAIIVTSDSAIKTAKDLEGKTISCQEGTTGEQYLLDNNYSVQSFKTGAEAVSALTAGKVDAVVIDDAVAQALSDKKNGATKVLDEALTQENYAIAIKKGNDEFTKQVNDALKQLKDEGKVAEIFAKYELPYDAE